jgi:hypothetical protein
MKNPKPILKRYVILAAVADDDYEEWPVVDDFEQYHDAVAALRKMTRNGTRLKHLVLYESVYVDLNG